jgi:hypothetical protein
MPLVPLLRFSDYLSIQMRMITDLSIMTVGRIFALTGAVMPDATCPIIPMMVIVAQTSTSQKAHLYERQRQDG